MSSIDNTLSSDESSSDEGPELEIEKKFSIPDAEAANKMEQRLASLGFEVTHKEHFVDWYFDLPAPHWHFSLMDCWFRYREKKVKVLKNWGWKGAWQVKRGQKKEDGGDNTMENDGMTVYEELQGKDAKELILNMLAELGDIIPAVDETMSSSSASNTNNMHYDHDIPYLAGSERLVPFARLETFRTCYEATNSDGEFSSLKVDVDKTNFGHMVGEVEAVIKDDDADDKMQVDAAKKQISTLVDLICAKATTTTDSMAAIGKLEYYLMNNQPEHYNACVKAGVI